VCQNVLVAELFESDAAGAECGGCINRFSHGNDFEGIPFSIGIVASEARI
jgi:hypothetical protein